MPPCTWVLRLAQRSAAGARQRGRDRRGVGELVAAGDRPPWPRPHTAEVASSVATTMLAQWCLTAWYMPMTRPNCTRSLAYAAAISVVSQGHADRLGREHHSDRSTSVCAAPRVTVTGAESSETLSGRGGSDRGSPGTSTVTRVAPLPHARTTSSPARSDQDPRQAPPSTAPAEPDAVPSTTVQRSPESDARRERPVGERGQGRPWWARPRPRAPWRWRSRSGRRHRRDRTSELLDDHHELLEAVAGPAVLLGQVQTQPAELGQLVPPLGQ